MCYEPRFPLLSSADPQLDAALRLFADTVLFRQTAADQRTVYEACQTWDLNRLATIVAWVRDCGPIATEPGQIGYDLAAGLCEQFRYRYPRHRLWAELDHLLPAWRVHACLILARRFAQSDDFYAAVEAELMTALHERGTYIPDFEIVNRIAGRVPQNGGLS